MVNLSAENAAFLNDVVSSGQFPSREAAIDAAVKLLRAESQPAKLIPSQDDQQSIEDWCNRFDAWADSHQRLESEADDSRESIYAGRGE